MGPLLFRAGAFSACEIGAGDVALLQRFFDDNPEYFLTVNHAPPRSDEAHQEYKDLPPPEMPFTGRWIIGFTDDAGRLIGVGSILSDFLAAHVWHVGLFIVATSLHGKGAATSLYAGLEDWMRSKGARWMRLGVVIGNARGERFWERNGYVETRQRSGIPTGAHTSTVRVMVKALGSGSIADYLSLVERDRPESQLA